MTPILEQPVQRLVARLEANPTRSLIALAGLPGAGKSTLSARLAEEVNTLAGPHTMMALSMDGFHLTKAQLSERPDAEAAFARRGAPWTFDAPALAAHLRALRTGDAEVEWPDFQHEIGDPMPAAHRVPPTTRIVLVEGLYLLLQDQEWSPVSAAFDERWYLDTPLNVSLERLIARHMAVWGLSRAAAESRVATNDGLNAQIVWDSKHFADWRLLAQTGGEGDSLLRGPSPQRRDMETAIAAAYWSLGCLRSEQLPQIALAWLEAGLDSPTMRVLAGESRPIMSEVGPMFEQMLAELNLEVPAQPEAARQFARHVAQEILDDTKTPYIGARELWTLSLDDKQAIISLSFTGLASEYEDFGDYQHLKCYSAEYCQQIRKKIEAQIVEEARKLLAS